MAACIYFMAWMPSPLWLVISGNNLIGLFMCACIRGKGACRVQSVNDYELNKKEAKNCARKSYIWNSIVIGSILWVVGFTSLYEDIEHAFEDPWISYLIVGLCFIMDIMFIKTKNLKYAYSSYL